MPTEKEIKLTLEELKKVLSVCREAKEEKKEVWHYEEFDPIIEKFKEKIEARKDETN